MHDKVNLFAWLFVVAIAVTAIGLGILGWEVVQWIGRALGWIG
jgi:hypothetical protein